MSATERLGQVELREGDMTVYEHPDEFRTLYVRGGAMAVTVDLTAGQAAELARLLTTEPETVSIFGQSRFIVDKLIKILRGAAGKHHNHGSIRETRRGSYFDLEILVDDEPSGHVARVSVEITPWGTAPPAAPEALTTEPADEELEP